MLRTRHSRLAEHEAGDGMMAVDTYLGMRGLHFLVHLQGIMMKPHFNKNLQKDIN